LNNYDTINIMVPTYKRADKFRRMYKSAIETAVFPERVLFTVCRNTADDSVYMNASNIHWVMESTTQPNLSTYYNLMYDETAKIDKLKDALVSMCGDDFLFATKEWDKRILDEVNKRDGLALVWCNDDYLGKEDCAVNFFTTREVVKGTDLPFMCPAYGCDAIDVIWTEIAKQAGIAVYLEDVHISHLHATRQEMDHTYERLRTAYNGDLKPQREWIMQALQNMRNNFIY